MGSPVVRCRVAPVPAKTDSRRRSDRDHPLHVGARKGLASAAATGAGCLGQVLSSTLLSGNRQCGSSTMRSILRAPKSSLASKVRLPPNHTSTGQVTIAVESSTMVAFAILLGAGPPGAKCTASTTGEGIWPSWRTVTVVREPAVRTLAIDPSTASVVKSHEYQNHARSWCSALLMKKA